MAKKNHNGMKTLKNLMEHRHLSVERVAVDLGVTFMTVYRWLSNKSEPSPLAREKLKEKFGIEWD
ncbi:MAG: helix-turn-helix domain-containing protein [Bacteroidota bacterium]